MAYFDGNAAYELNTRSYRQARPQRRPVERPDFQVIESPRQREAEVAAISPMMLFCFKVVIALAITFAVVAAARVFLTTATTSTLLESKALAAQIESARTAGDDLEIQQNILTNTTRIQRVASESLGMGPAVGHETISLDDWILATDSNGVLSLDGSLSASVGAPALY